MREILFRGKKRDNGEWAYGDLCQVLPGCECKFNLIFSQDECATSSIVLPETVGQYIGLIDKNGKKIFEGDCFKTYCAGLPVYKHIVSYYPEHFAFMARCIEMNTVHYLSDYRTSAIEVIGNIYDNPELLEVTE